ncbi:MAG: hypothetical protein A2Y67_02115 [Candidatus Buchananbacteria bacterium RBG_13_39_9]|uniref:Antitoxin SocA-like Panacea domain-containing protein n=1 Tax=Candidatus Buchananbacteria bacterium RBG_13_39_9 TaxID=1797531 RepID=A0A1G1XSI7_9BACT|nr:MAG: hypothetical protein A2Y67_02115 [Candidatus Buchananbacteria bacterium RBG_13_39_9]
MPEINVKKYENAILYLAQKLGGEVHGKKKLAKLLYFADFDFFEKYEKMLTGEVYKKLPMGPYPEHLETILENLSKEGKLDIKLTEEYQNYKPTEIYKNLKDPDVSVFDPQEKEMLDRIVLKYGQLNGKDLENLTHAEAPYIGTESNNEIMYELAFYRGTDFSQYA